MMNTRDWLTFATTGVIAGAYAMASAALSGAGLVMSVLLAVAFVGVMVLAGSLLGRRRVSLWEFVLLTVVAFGVAAAESRKPHWAARYPVGSDLFEHAVAASLAVLLVVVAMKLWRPPRQP